MTEQKRTLDDVEAEIAAEEAEDAATSDDEPRQEIKTYPGFAGTGAAPHPERADEDWSW